MQASPEFLRAEAAMASLRAQGIEPGTLAFHQACNPKEWKVWRRHCAEVQAAAIYSATARP